MVDPGSTDFQAVLDGLKIFQKLAVTAYFQVRNHNILKATSIDSYVVSCVNEKLSDHRRKKGLVGIASVKIEHALLEREAL